MPNFLETIFKQLQRSADRVVLREVRGAQIVSATGREVLERVQRARAFLRSRGVQPGDRCALLGANSISWIASDLALMAENAIVVPLYSRQAAADLVGTLQDCTPRLLLTGNEELGAAVAAAWQDAPPRVLFDDATRDASLTLPFDAAPLPRNENDFVTIIYTSGTSGEPKGVCLTTGNLTHMLSCTTERLDQLMGQNREPDRVFHYAPFNFAASWVLLLSCLSRESVLTLSTDLTKLPDEIRLSAPHYFLNVPTLLERVRRGVEDALSKRGAPIRSLYAKARNAWERKNSGSAHATDALWLGLGRRLIFSKIKERFGAHVRALICGSAPLAPETQKFFLMLGIPVLQAYGLTETTAICTLDDPRVPIEP